LTLKNRVKRLFVLSVQIKTIVLTGKIQTIYGHFIGAERLFVLSVQIKAKLQTNNHGHYCDR
jgi:hypothetical protein